MTEQLLLVCGIHDNSGVRGTGGDKDLFPVLSCGGYDMCSSPYIYNDQPYILILLITCIPILQMQKLRLQELRWLTKATWLISDSKFYFAASLSAVSNISKLDPSKVHSLHRYTNLIKIRKSNKWKAPYTYLLLRMLVLHQFFYVKANIYSCSTN